jgi:hypothetical protein
LLLLVSDWDIISTAAFRLWGGGDRWGTYEDDLERVRVGVVGGSSFATLEVGVVSPLALPLGLLLGFKIDLPLATFDDVDTRDLGVPGGVPTSVPYGEPGIGGSWTVSPCPCP